MLPKQSLNQRRVIAYKTRYLPVDVIIEQILATRLDAKTHDMDAVLSAYKSRHWVEDRFRNTKSTLKIRPVFLQNDDRIGSLVLVTVIALTVYTLIE